VITDDMPRRAARHSMLIRIASAMTFLIWLAFLIGLAGRWWWVADLFSHFRLQYALLLLPCAAILMSSKRWPVAMLALVGTVMMGASVLWYSGLSSEARADSGEAFRFVTFNKYWRNDQVERIGDYLESTHADVIALQEVESPHFLAQLRARASSYPHVYATTRLRHGVVLLSRWPLTHTETIELVPGGAPIAKVQVEWRRQPITVIGAHLHWPIGASDVSLRNAELARLMTVAHEVSGPLVIGGDFNLTAWSPNFQQVRSDSKIRDCAEGHRLPVTWPTFFPPLGIRIDQCLHSQEWETTQVASGPYLGSDHYPTINDLRFVGAALQARN
jgi:endonuclease/exonuclease/phosphatase (EEP) superfamily protein YafD